MRCKPGDLAIVVNDLEVPANNGALVNVIARARPGRGAEAMSRRALQRAAREAGERFFEDPKGCALGHTVFYVSSGDCKECRRPLNLPRISGPDDYARVQVAQGRGARTARQISIATGFSESYIREMIGSREWSAEHEAVLRRRYARDGAVKLADMLSRNAKAVRAKANRMGLTRERPEKPTASPPPAHNPFGL